MKEKNNSALDLCKYSDLTSIIRILDYLNNLKRVHNENYISITSSMYAFYLPIILTLWHRTGVLINMDALVYKKTTTKPNSSTLEQT